MVRTAWPAEALTRAGELEIVELPPILDITETRGHNGRPEVTKIGNLPDVDLMVFTRVLSERLVSVIRYVRKQGIPVICDIDDDFRNMPSNSPAVAAINPRLNPRYSWRHFVNAAKEADWVTVSTPALLRYRPEACSLIRNLVPEFYLSIPRPRGGTPIVGWSGTVQSHPGDLDVTQGGVARAVQEMAAKFVVIGEAEGVAQILNLREEPLCTGRLGHPTYAQHLAHFDVGIVPLALNQYTNAKSALTPLSMAALGVWWVGSASPEYLRLYAQLEMVVRTVSGHLRPPAGIAGPRGREWRREVLRGLRTPDNEREEAIAHIKEYIKAEQTVEAKAHERLEVWSAVAQGVAPPC
jgi:hypothetical protein